jgi:hypothetical protein
MLSGQSLSAPLVKVASTSTTTSLAKSKDSDVCLLEMSLDEIRAAGKGTTPADRHDLVSLSYDDFFDVGGHYAAAKIDLKSRRISIYDGKKYALKENWDCELRKCAFAISLVERSMSLVERSIFPLELCYENANGLCKAPTPGTEVWNVHAADCPLQHNTHECMYLAMDAIYSQVMTTSRQELQLKSARERVITLFLKWLRADNAPIFTVRLATYGKFLDSTTVECGTE